jgi:hypothetical protein
MLVGPLIALLLVLAPGLASAQKTDVIKFRNGNQITAEIKELKRGLLKLSTNGMRTVYAEWPKIVTVSTDKRFYVELDDGTTYFGSLASGTADSVVIRADSTRVATQTQAIVWLQRLKSTFWRALDGHLKLGFGFTQQNAKTDLNLDGEVRYPRLSNLTKLTFNTSFGWQNNVDNIIRINGTLVHARTLGKRWFYLGFGSGARNSQLSLQGRVTAGGGLGRALVESNRVNLLLWVAPAVSWEQYVDQAGAVAVPLALAGDFLYFVWESLDTDISSKLMVMPMLNDLQRWRINFSLSASREIIKDVDIGVTIYELFDSRPPDASINKNDFSITTTLGWSF